MLLGVVPCGDPGFAGFDFDFFVRIAQQMARMLQRIFGVCFQYFKGFTRLVRGVVLKAFQRLEQTLDLGFHALQ
ncbi:hypothetical protein D3C72_2546400 [compost metagenome]